MYMVANVFVTPGPLILYCPWFEAVIRWEWMTTPRRVHPLMAHLLSRNVEASVGESPGLM